MSDEISNETSVESPNNEMDAEAKAEDDVNVSKEFYEQVVKFVKIDDLMRKKQKEMTELRSQRKPCEDFIIKYLDQIDESVVEITNGKLRKNKSETKVPLNQDIIKEAIETKVKDPKIVDSILKSMDDLRPKNVRVNIKRTSQRAPKNKVKKVPTKNKK